MPVIIVIVFFQTQIPTAIIYFTRAAHPVTHACARLSPRLLYKLTDNFCLIAIMRYSLLFILLSGFR